MGEGIQVRLFRAADCDTDNYLVVAKVRKRLAVNKQRSHGEVQSQEVKCVEGKGQYCVEVSNRFTALEDLDAEMDINSVWKMITGTIKIPAN
jgi:hypothetical protein